VEGLAAMHAHWGGRERLEKGGEPIQSPEQIMRYVDIARPGAGHILNNCADQFKAHWPDLIWEVYEKHPAAMIDRTADGHGFTLIHGDANCTNILVPKAADANRPIYILDRQPFDWSLTTWLGTYDLMYALVLDWDTEIRRALEKTVLQHYHDELIRHGVEHYSWEQLWHDYRLTIPLGIYIGTEWCRGQFYPDTMARWMSILQSTLTAMDDLECASLWS
ncbi:MAG: ecdysteroid 22-kinase family protein, partial [Anaerolineae bacterium]|nr:ecdysteroid 22-kinase family protein [Anaerolineae bacterium]